MHKETIIIISAILAILAIIPTVGVVDAHTSTITITTEEEDKSVNTKIRAKVTGDSEIDTAKSDDSATIKIKTPVVSDGDSGNGRNGGGGDGGGDVGEVTDRAPADLFRDLREATDEFGQIVRDVEEGRRAPEDLFREFGNFANATEEFANRAPADFFTGQ